LKACKIEELPEGLHAVFISHNHFDHLDASSIYALNERYGRRLQWFVPAGTAELVRRCAGATEIMDNVHEMVWWEERPLRETNVSVVMTPANHGSRRTLLNENEALWGSWAVVGRKGRFWFGGDTAYCDVFRQIGEFGPFDLAAIPIGAYYPRRAKCI